jgi:hypothetical protein
VSANVPSPNPQRPFGAGNETGAPQPAIATPTQAIRIKRPGAAPRGIDWTRLSAKDLEKMPILADIRRMTTSNA